MELNVFRQPRHCVYMCMSICSVFVCLTLSNQHIGPSTSTEGDIKSLHNYHPTFKELQSGALQWAVDHLKEA